MSKQSVFKQESNYQDVIKVFAFVTMIVDHVGMFFFPDVALLRVIGRFAMPVYCSASAVHK